MYQGTTPTIPLLFRNVDLTGARLYLSFLKENAKDEIVFKSGENFDIAYDGTNTTGALQLTQEQTLSMEPGTWRVMCRFIFPDGNAGVTTEKRIAVESVHPTGVISYEVQP